MKNLFFILVAVFTLQSNAYDITSSELLTGNLLKVEYDNEKSVVTVRLCSTALALCDSEVVGVYSFNQIQTAQQELTRRRPFLKVLVRRKAAIAVTGAGVGAAAGTFVFPAIGTSFGAVVGSLLAVGASNGFNGFISPAIDESWNLFYMENGLNRHTNEKFKGSMRELLKALNEVLPVNSKFLD